MEPVWIFVAVGLGAMFGLCVYGGRRICAPSWAYLAGRPVHKERWKELYYAADLVAVMACLQTIREAYFLRREDVWRLLPSDHLLAIHGAAYPRGGAEALELESLARHLRKRFGIAEDAVLALKDPTVEDILRLCLARRQVEEQRTRVSSV